MPPQASFLTPEHQDELFAKLGEAKSQGATDDDLKALGQMYMQHRAITDRNYPEPHKASDAPEYSGSVLKGIPKRVGSLPSGALGSPFEPDPIILRTTGKSVPRILNPAAAMTSVPELVAGMGAQVGHYGKRAVDAARAGDLPLAAVSAAQAGASINPLTSATVPLGEDLKNTGNLENVGGAMVDAAGVLAPEVLPGVGRGLVGAGDSAMSSLFAPRTTAELATATRAGADLANEGMVAGSQGGVTRKLLSREQAASDAARAAESTLASPKLGNQVGVRRIIDSLKARLADTAGQIPGRTKGAMVAGDPELAANIDNEISGLEELSKPGGRQVSEMLNYKRGLRNAAPSQARDLAATAAEQELGRVSPALGDALSAETEAQKVSALPRSKPPVAHDLVGGALSELHKVLFSPAAKTLSAVTMNRIGQLMQRGDVGAALALARAATTERTQ